MENKESSIYERRYPKEESQARLAAWRLLCEQFLQRYINPTDVVLDLGANEGFFITNIRAGFRVAVDIDPRIARLKDQGKVDEVVISDAAEFSSKLSRPADLIFMSNFLEHLPSKAALYKVLEECGRALVPGGRLMVIQPNIRYVGPAYWDYVDHSIPLTEHSLREALEISGFEVTELIPRFLPYTIKKGAGRLISAQFGSLLLRLYLRAPLLWRFFGQQTFAYARKAP